MNRLLMRAAAYLISAAIGIVVTDVLFTLVGWETFNVVWSKPLAFVVAVVIFGALQAALSPFFEKLVQDNAPTLSRVVGLITTYAALLLAVLVAPDGLEIGGILGWVLGPAIVWLAFIGASLILPKLFAQQNDDRSSSDS